MAASSILVIKNTGCGPHSQEPSDAERRRIRVDDATKPRDEHVLHRLVHRLPLDGHAQNILAQVNGISAILNPALNASPNSSSSSSK